MATIKIVSDGTPAGTTIYDESGKKLGLVQRLEIVIDVNATTALARMKFAMPILDLENVEVEEEKTIPRKTP